MLDNSIEDLLTRTIITLGDDQTLGDAIGAMRSNSVSCIIVAKNEKPIGILTERDLARMASGGNLIDKQTPVPEIMTKPVMTIPMSLTYLEVLERFRSNNIRHLAVVDDEGLLRGIVTETDIMRALETIELLEVISIGDLVKGKSIVTAPPGKTVRETLKLMDTKKIGCIAIENNGKAIGIITERDIPILLDNEIDLDTTTAADVMSTPVISISEELGSYNALDQMLKKNLRHLIVVNRKGMLSGIVSRSDFTKGLVKRYIDDLQGIIYKQKKEISDIQVKLAESRAKDSEHKYRTIFEESSDAIYIVDIDSGKIIDCNWQASVLDRQSIDELRGTRIFDLHPEQERATLIEKLESMTKAGLVIRSTQFHRLRLNNTLSNIELTASVTNIGEKSAWLIVVHDITDRERIIRAREFFSQVTAHELRTPLTKLQSSMFILENISSENPAIDQIDHAIQTLSGAYSNFDRIVEMTSIISSIHLDRIRETLTPVPIMVLLGSSVEMVQSMILKKNRRLLITNKQEGEIANPVIYANMVLLPIAFNEIMSNSVKYTPDDKAINISVSTKNDSVELKIADEGVGIAPDEMAGVAEPFYSLENIHHHHSSEYDFLGGGIGLGVTVAKSIIESIGGTFAITSSGVGKGTTVTVTFPLVHEEA